MKSILFVMQFPPPIHGASIMSKTILTSEVINNEFDCHYVNITTAANLDDIGKGNLKKLKRTLRVWHRISLRIRELNPSVIVFTPNSSGRPFYRDCITTMIIKLFKRSSSQLVLYFHNKGVKTRENRWLDDLLYRCVFRNTKVLLLSECLYEDISKYCIRDNVWFCPNGIDVEYMDTVSENEKDRTPQLLWLSNIMKTKGIMEYLSALRLLKERGVKFKALVVGASTMEMSGMELRKAIFENGLEGYVNYVGKRYGDDKIKSFLQSDIFVLPSYTEAYPLTIIEAMAFGLPVVASNVGAISEMVKNNITGLLIGSDRPELLNTFRPDPIELADKLQYLIDNPEVRKNMGVKAKDCYHNLLSKVEFEHNFVTTMKSICD